MCFFVCASADLESSRAGQVFIRDEIVHPQLDSRGRRRRRFSSLSRSFFQSAMLRNMIYFKQAREREGAREKCRSFLPLA